jgi:signal transduction histidine kinase/CheY-like chemotaxis protein
VWVLLTASPTWRAGEHQDFYVSVVEDITERRSQEALIRTSNALLEGITRVRREVLVEADPSRSFDQMLALMLEATGSEYGFIGEVLQQPGGQPYLKTHAITDMSWSPETSEFYEKNAPACLEFYKLDSLFGAVMTSRATVIANGPGHDPRRGGLPPWHPSLDAFLGLPFFHGEELIGMVGLANRAGGYDHEVIRAMGSILATYSSLMFAYGLERRRKESEQERLKFEAQLQHTQKLESLGVLAGGIAHDFNSMLASILGYCDLAMLKLPAGTPVHELVGEAMNGARRAADLTKQMLACSGKGHFVVEALDLSALTEDMTRLVEISISKKCVLKFSLMPDLPAILADATQVCQIIMNLTINASEAIGNRSGVIAVTTGVMHWDRAYLGSTCLVQDLPEGLYVYMEVADNGVGMPEKTLASVFDPFFTTKFTGRGLGLSAVLGVVRGHRGAIKTYSEPGKGTTFKVLFPATASPAHVPEEREIEKAAGLGGGTVLIVDDEESVRGVTRQMLEAMGFTVLTAADGRAGVEVFRAEQDQIRLVLPDMTMPHLDGEQAFRETRRIRGDAQFSRAAATNTRPLAVLPARTWPGSSRSRSASRN